MSNNDRMMASIEQVPILPSSPKPEQTPANVPRPLVGRRWKAPDSKPIHHFALVDPLGTEENDMLEITEESTSQFINPAPAGKSTKQSLDESELSSIDINECDCEWLEIEKWQVPKIDRNKHEEGWDTVEISKTAAGCNLSGEDDYSIETFQPNTKKQELLNNPGQEIERLKVKLKYAERNGEGVYVENLKKRLETTVAARDELEAQMED